METFPLPRSVRCAARAGSTISILSRARARAISIFLRPRTRQPDRRRVARRSTTKWIVIWFASGSGRDGGARKTGKSEKREGTSLLLDALALPLVSLDFCTSFPPSTFLPCLEKWCVVADYLVFLHLRFFWYLIRRFDLIENKQECREQEFLSFRKSLTREEFILSKSSLCKQCLDYVIWYFTRFSREFKICLHISWDKLLFKTRYSEQYSNNVNRRFYRIILNKNSSDIFW